MNTLYQDLIGSFIFLSIIYTILIFITGPEKSSSKNLFLIYIGIVCYQIFKIVITQEANSAITEIAGFTLSTIAFLAVIRKAKNKK